MSYDVKHGYPTKDTVESTDTLLVKDKDGTIYMAKGASDTFEVGTETLTFVNGILTDVQTT